MTDEKPFYHLAKVNMVEVTPRPPPGGLSSRNKFMPAKHPQFVNGEIYHTILRGIAGQKIFLDTKDYLRCLLSLYKFNDKNSVFHTSREMQLVWQVLIPAGRGVTSTSILNLNIAPSKLPDVLIENRKTEDSFVEILGFCLMPDHIHLLVRQLVDNGISMFFQKMGGYSTYFNKKHERFGSLFQRPFRAIHIRTQNQLLIVIAYIHLNPISLIEPSWKIKGIFYPEKVIKFLESYSWSSYPHYLGKKDVSWLVDSKFLKNILTSPKDFRNFVNARISHKAELKSFLRETKVISLE